MNIGGDIISPPLAAEKTEQVTQQLRGGHTDKATSSHQAFHTLCKG